MQIIKIWNDANYKTYYINTSYIKHFYYDKDENETRIVMDDKTPFLIEGNAVSSLVKAMTDNNKAIEIKVE